MTFDYVQPEDPVSADGAALLTELRSALTRYVIFPSEQAADAITLYIAATHAQTVWEHATRLVIKSPIKRCGKTRLQEVARETVHKPLPTTNISPAALARSIDENDPPTLILDEADTVWGKKDQRSEGAEDLRGILNSGHSRGWPYVRWDATARKPELCPTFAMAIIGGIGDMPDTIEDRAVVISMRRRAPHEKVAQWRSRRVLPQLRDLRERLHEWVVSQHNTLTNAEPELPVEDRAADCWESLVAVADAAGGDWPKRARAACRAIAGDAEVEEATTSGERLLADLKVIYKTAHFLYTTTILEHLTKIDEAPWAEWSRSPNGRAPINARGLAGLLKPYKIRPRDGREDGTGPQKKGYYRADLTDSFARYIRDDRDTATHTHDPQTSSVADPVAPGFAATATGNEQGFLADVADIADIAEPRLNSATVDTDIAVALLADELGATTIDADTWRRLATGYDT
ncbi:MAG TPA: DUF3631 domain-containing protein [Pseudonocardiaceae bacterium]|nr:DUF3631 domain-containing protein [Pseudonocardiaceae bacterium]